MVTPIPEKDNLFIFNTPLSATRDGNLVIPFLTAIQQTHVNGPAKPGAIRINFI